MVRSRFLSEGEGPRGGLSKWLSTHVEGFFICQNLIFMLTFAVASQPEPDWSNHVSQV